MVQLTSKFITCLIFSCVFFKALLSTQVSHVSKEIAHVVLLLWSLDFIMSILHGSLQELTIYVKSQANKLSLHSTSTAFSSYVSLSQSVVVVL